MGNRPRVSIVILSHRPDMVGEALASCLAQDYDDVEVTVEHAKKYWPEKLTAAVERSVGEFVILLCDDDQLAPSFVRECVEAADLSGAGITFTDRLFFGEGGTVEARYFSQIPRTSVSTVVIHAGTFAFGSPLPMTCLIRRSLWDAVGGYDTAMPHADTEFFYRCVVSGASLAYVAKPLFEYRRHPAQQSRVTGSLEAAQRAFHAKHFAAFGVMFGEKDADGKVPGTMAEGTMFGWTPKMIPAEEAA